MCTTMTPFFFPLLPLYPSLSFSLSVPLTLSLSTTVASHVGSTLSPSLVSNPGNPFSSRTEIPRRTAFSLLATFYLFLLLPLLRHRFLFFFVHFFIFFLGANLPPVDYYQRSCRIELVP